VVALNIVAFTVVSILLGGGDPAPGTPAARLVDAVAAAQPADEPFPQLTETTLRVGRTSLEVVVADESGERSQGLRRRETIGAYDAMLFAYTEPVRTTFTMSTVPVPLDIGFYAAGGRLVSRLRMEPCAGTDFECPLYAPEGPFVYALETLADELPRGRLRVPG
jgi:uncharacterized membrane protein (UPF0127 family)